MTVHQGQGDVAQDGPSLLSTPSEIISTIINYCTFESLQMLSLACGRLHQAAQLPLKMRKVDLSTHNGLCVPPLGIPYPQEDYAPDDQNDEAMKKQDELFKSISARPLLAGLIHDLT